MVISRCFGDSIIPSHPETELRPEAAHSQTSSTSLSLLPLPLPLHLHLHHPRRRWNLFVCRLFVTLFSLFFSHSFRGLSTQAQSLIPSFLFSHSLTRSDLHHWTSSSSSFISIFLSKPTSYQNYSDSLVNCFSDIQVPTIRSGLSTTTNSSS